MKKLYFIFLVSIIITSCASTSTSVTNSWQKPDTHFSLAGLNKKILVVALSANDTQRRSIESAYVKHLGSMGVPSYTYFNTPLENIKQDQAVAQLKKDDFGGAMVIRLTDQQHSGSQRKTAVGITPSVYWGFGRNISAGIGLSIYPGYNTKQDDYTLQTSVYQFPKDELIWSGDVLESNPDDLNSLANDVADAVFAKMKSDGILN